MPPCSTDPQIRAEKIEECDSGDDSCYLSKGKSGQTEVVYAGCAKKPSDVIDDCEIDNSLGHISNMKKCFCTTGDLCNSGNDPPAITNDSNPITTIVIVVAVAIALLVLLAVGVLFCCKNRT